MSGTQPGAGSLGSGAPCLRGLRLYPGNVAPPLAGAATELHVTPPDAPEAVLRLTTNSSGAHTTGLVMQAAGTWKILARFVGDAKTQPDDSPGCLTTISSSVGGCR